MASSSDAAPTLHGWCANVACRGNDHAAPESVGQCADGGCPVAGPHSTLTAGCTSNAERKSTGWRDLVPKPTATVGSKRLGATSDDSNMMSFTGISHAGATSCSVVLRICSACRSYINAPQDTRTPRGAPKRSAAYLVICLFSGCRQLGGGGNRRTHRRAVSWGSARRRSMSSGELARRRHACTGELARRRHACTGERARRRHACTGNGLVAGTRVPGNGLVAGTRVPGNRLEMELVAEFARRYKGAKQSIAEGSGLVLSDVDERFKLRQLQMQLTALRLMYRSGTVPSCLALQSFRRGARRRT